MRGGTSKAVIFHKKDLPADRSLWPELFLKVMGSPDKKQIDGMGGTVSSTSKIAVISPSDKEGIDVDYEFFQVQIDRPIVNENMNCGNISSAVGPFSIDEGLVLATDPITKVKIFQVNTGKVIEEHVRTKNGKPLYSGDAIIEGVPGSSSPIDVFFHEPTGAGTGKAFPSGNRSEIHPIPGYDPIEMTLFDCANPVVFIRAQDLGLNGTESVELNENKDFLRRIETIRAVAAEKMGLAKSWEEVLENGSSTPLIAFISQPQDYKDLDGKQISKDEIDLCCRGFNLGKLHRAYPMSLAVATAAASKIEGTLVHQLVRKSSNESVRLGHVSGSTTAKVVMDGEEVKMVGVIRTARRIMDGFVYLPSEDNEDRNESKPIQDLIKVLGERQISARWFESRTSLRAYIESILSPDAVVASGGSTTLDQIGFHDLLHKVGCRYIDCRGSAENRDQNILDSMKSDFYFSSVSAISQDGELFLVDGTGNRVAAFAYGPKKVVVVAGVNKIVLDASEAETRIQTIAAPMNAKRRGKKDLPCAETNECSDCRAKSRMCCKYLRIGFSREAERIQVLLVNEDLGF
ncbi:MAG: PrpF domain-containing protein [Bacillota bacterium]|nr:PrpF domain-containing protein [Bacillota bacterium]